MFVFQPYKQQIFIVNEWMVLLFNGKKHSGCFSFSSVLCHPWITLTGFTVLHLCDDPNTINPATPKSWWLGIIIIHHHITPGDASANFWASSVFWIAYFLFENEVLIELWRCKTKAPYLKGFAGERSVWKQRYESLCMWSSQTLCAYDVCSALHRCLDLISALNLLSSICDRLPPLNDCMTVIAGGVHAQVHMAPRGEE